MEGMLSRNQREILRIARSRGWFRPSGANDIRSAKVLVRLGLLKPRPGHEAGPGDYPSLIPTETDE